MSVIISLCSKGVLVIPYFIREVPDISEGASLFEFLGYCWIFRILSINSSKYFYSWMGLYGQ